MIEVLPDSVANQIAAGEVIQRPASVVKELIENAVDAGSTQIDVVVKDAGRTLVQVIDNGSGMSDTDARLSFERHATSKIRKADDLMDLYTFGFRGEALASIASIAEVELKTRRADDELGTKICINGAIFESQEAVSCAAGSSFSVKNIFYNVPARRKFLKSDNVEIKHIIAEFQRVALCNPHIAFSLTSNGTRIYDLPKGNRRQRIANVFGKNVNNSLINVEVETSVVNISGFVGKPEQAKRSANEQFFFVNGRFFKSPYFQKAVQNAFDQLIPQGAYPLFFLYFTINPKQIDVNIHPTKVEIKFEQEQSVWQILNAAVREALGKFALSPTIDFNTEGSIDIPVITENTKFSAPKVEVDNNFNPFSEKENKTNNFKHEKSIAGWEKLYDDGDSFELEDEKTEIQHKNESKLFNENQNTYNNFFQIDNGFIATPTKSGLMIIDQQRAHRKILFEQFLKTMEMPEKCSQQELFPKNIELSASDFLLIENAMDDLQHIGFDVRSLGQNTVIISGLPSCFANSDAESVLRMLIEDLKDENTSFAGKHRERLALALAKTAAIGTNKQLTIEEMSDLTGKLLACKTPNVCPDGKPTFYVITTDEIKKRFLK